MKIIGMDYQAIHACPNNDIIYYKEKKSKEKFPKCDESRYQTNKVTKKVPHKVLRYIPIIPCPRQLFRCKIIEQFMDYHATKII